jgi:hypothetical protein
MPEGIFTFITNYRGGAYIERIYAPDVLTAAHFWADRISTTQEVQRLDTQAFRNAFDAEIAEYPPTPIEDNPNVWALSYFYGRNRMDVHIVKTDPGPKLRAPQK